MEFFRKLRELLWEIISDRQVGEGYFMGFAETIDVLIQQIFTRKVLVERVVVDALENDEFVHVDLWFAPRPE
jgi:hypothetical protein